MMDKRMRINTPSACDMASICGMDSTNRFRSDTPRDRRLEFSRPRFFSSSQQSQQSYSQPMSEICLRPPQSSQISISEDLEQRLGSLESLVSGIGESLHHIRKDLENQNLKVAILLKEEEGTKRRLLDGLETLEGKLASKVEGLGQMLKEESTMVERLVQQRNQVPVQQLPQPVPQPVPQAQPKKQRPQLKDDDNVVVRDLFSEWITEESLTRMRKKVIAARKSQSKRKVPDEYSSRV